MFVGVDNCLQFVRTNGHFLQILYSNKFTFKKHFTDNHQERKDRLLIKLLSPPSLNFIHIWDNWHTNEHVFGFG